jgi:hypothetical protein
MQVTPKSRRRKSQRPRYILELEPTARHPNLIRSLRAVLKNAWRAHGMRCVGLRETSNASSSCSRTGNGQA